MGQYIVTAGGGGVDAVLAIDGLLQLAFYFTTDEELRSIFGAMKYDMLTLLTSLSKHENISAG